MPVNAAAAHSDLPHANRIIRAKLVTVTIARINPALAQGLRPLFLAAFFAAVGCAPERPRVPVPEPLPETLDTAVRAGLRAPSVTCGGSQLEGQQITAYYPASGTPPLWITQGAPGLSARQLRDALRLVGRDGLVPASYGLDDIDRYWQARSPAELACLDLLLTDAYRRYSVDVHSGRADPQDADPTWTLRADAFDPLGALQTATRDGTLAALLSTLPPPHTGYRRLRVALQQYQTLAQQGGWTSIPPGPKLEPQTRHEQIALLRARLRAEGEHDVGGDDDLYDAELAEAVKRFQYRHGLTTDGVVGERTRSMLNIRLEEKIAKIRRTLERWRWLPRTFGEQYILVNTAGFELEVIEQERRVLSMRVIVGTPDQATPSFTAVLQSLVINPYWNVPPRIARDTLLAKQQADPNYFRARAFRLFRNGGKNAREIDPASIDWGSMRAEDFTYRLRQDPGPRNSMGRLAFSLPNRFDIFLHGTPESGLFARDARTYSEGCVRIQHPLPLALYTLRHADDWSEERIQRAIDARHHKTLHLPQPMPVYVLYLPNWVDDAGRVHFRDDVYQRDSVLTRYYPAAVE